MLKENLKLVCRKLFCERVYAVINILGLAIALCAALLMYNHVVKEWSTDSFHVKGKHIYRVIDKNEHCQKWSSSTSAPLGIYTQAEHPEIKNCARVVEARDYALKSPENKTVLGTARCMYTDAEFFDMFTFPLVSGSVTSGTDPDWVVLSEKISRLYFPGENPLGKKILLKDCKRDDDKGREFRIVAVMKDIPANSTLQADVIADFSFLEKTVFQTWGMHGVLTFFELDKQADKRAIEIAMPQVIEKNYHWIRASEHVMKLQPLGDVYFNSEEILEMIPHGSKRFNWILCGITFLILILAACNYGMIKLACLSRNATSLGVQRCFGANNYELRSQLFWETALNVGVAFVLAVGLAFGLHPWFVHIISSQSYYPWHFSIGAMGVFVFLLFVFVLFTAWVLSFYIFRRLSREGIKEHVPASAGRVDMKQVLSFIQMCIFPALLFCSVVLLLQMNFIKNHQLGFDNHCVVNFGWVDRQLNMLTLTSEIKQNPDIISFSNGDDLPLIGEDPGTLSLYENPEIEIKTYQIHGDASYLETYQIHLAEGRNIARESYPANADEFFLSRPGTYPEILINRKFVEKLGGKNPIGTLLQDKGGVGHVYKVVGVVEDFHFLPLYQAVEPVYVIYDLPQLSYSMLMRYREGKRVEVLKWLEDFYGKKFMNSTVSYHEYDYSQLYEKDIALVKMTNVLTIIAILISGMGIFAFTVFMVESRVKEVALRKINGARVGQIILLFNRYFVLRVIIACITGLPIAHYLIWKWLEGFAYRIKLGLWIYLTVFFISLILVLLITTWHTWRAALRNPVEAIKGE